IRADIDQTQAALAGLSAPADEVAARFATTLDDEALTHWTAQADLVLARPGFLARLSPIRWYKARRVARFVRDNGLAGGDALSRAGHDEAALRPVRNRAGEIEARLGEPCEGLASLPPVTL